MADPPINEVSAGGSHQISMTKSPNKEATVYRDEVDFPRAP